MMTLSLHEAVVPSMLQILGSVNGMLDKLEAFAAERGVDPATLIDARLAPDMLPFGYQVKSCTEHSGGALTKVREGRFTPSRAPWPTDLPGLRARVADAMATLKAVDSTELDAIADRPMSFEMGEMKLPFTVATFLLSFSQPNFYFHATTAYDVLRAQGVKLGKTDFLGRLRVARG
ncbi:DUF1993 domain-containing protein [Sphingomonas sp. MMS24-JH45]